MSKNKPFYEKSDITNPKNTINITYGELLQKSSDEVDTWIDELRDYVITNWDKGQPPVIGQNEEDIIKKWSKLHEVNVKEFFTKKMLYCKAFINQQLIKIYHQTL